MLLAPTARYTCSSRPGLRCGAVNDVASWATGAMFARTNSPSVATTIYAQRRWLHLGALSARCAAAQLSFFAKTYIRTAFSICSLDRAVLSIRWMTSKTRGRGSGIRSMCCCRSLKILSLWPSGSTMGSGNGWRRIAQPQKNVRKSIRFARELVE